MQGIAELGAGKLYPKVPPYWALTAPLLGRAEEVEGLESKTLLWAQWNDFVCYLQAGASAREGKKKKKKDSRNILEVFSFQFEQNQIM